MKDSKRPEGVFKSALLSLKTAKKLSYERIIKPIKAMAITLCLSLLTSTKTQIIAIRIEIKIIVELIPIKVDGILNQYLQTIKSFLD